MGESYIPMMHKPQKGSAFVEILIVIGVITVLAAVVVIALNPSRQFTQARNAQRWQNINTLLDAISQRMTENRGLWTSGKSTDCPALPNTFTIIGSGKNQIDLGSCLVPNYVPRMVFDPSVGTAASTGFQIMRSSNGRITIQAPYAESRENISLSR